MWLWANDITTSRGEVPNETLPMMFSYCPNLMFLASAWYIDFQTGHFFDFFLTWGILLSLGKTCHKNNLKYSRTMYRIWHKSFSMIQSAIIKNWFPQSINRLHRFSLLFIPVTRFSDFCNKINMIKIKTKSLQNWEISFKWLLSLTVLLRAIFRTESKVYSGAFLEE